MSLVMSGKLLSALNPVQLLKSGSADSDKLLEIHTSKVMFNAWKRIVRYVKSARFVVAIFLRFYVAPRNNQALC